MNNIFTHLGGCSKNFHTAVLLTEIARAMATNGVERGVEKLRRADSIIDEQSQSSDEEHDVALSSYIHPATKEGCPFVC